MDKEGNIYIGQTLNGEKHGNGKLVNTKGEIVYEGEFKNGFRDGIGKYTSVDGDIWTCYFKDDFQRSVLKVEFANGDYFEGSPMISTMSHVRENIFGQSAKLVKVSSSDHLHLGNAFSMTKWEMFIRET